LGGSYWQEWQLVLFGTLVGGFFAVLGAVVEALVEDWRSSKREVRRKKEEAEEGARRKREEWIEIALNWDGERSLRRADLRGADLRGVNLGFSESWAFGADLSYADLSKADLSGANLRGTELTGANLREADLSNANLYGADLRSANLQGTRANRHTVWPEGFEVPEGVVIED
jgi:hypothetical protein